MTACTCRAASAGSPSCDHSSSAAALSDWIIASATSSWLPTPARSVAIANGTLIVDHATPVDHAPNDTAEPVAAIATPIVAGTVSDSSSKLVSSARFTMLTADRPHRVGAVEALGRQLPLEHLECRGAWQGRAHPDVRRPLLAPKVGLLGQEPAKFVRVELGAGQHHQRGHHLVADGRIGHRIHRDLGHVRMAKQHPLDGRGPQVFPVDAQPVTKPAGEIRIAGLVAVGQVAAVIDTAGHTLRIGLGVVVVALETAWAADIYQLADYANRTGLTGVDIADLDAVGQQTKCAWRRIRCAADRHPALRRPEAVDDKAAEPVSETLDVAGCSLIAVDRTQRIVGVVRTLGCGEHIGQWLADVVGVGGAVATDVRQKSGCRELAPQHH